MKLLLFVAVCLLAASTEAYKLSCQYEIINYDFAGQQIYNCYGDLINDGDLYNINSVVGDHHAGKSNIDVQALYFTPSHTTLMAQIPNNFGRFFPNIKAFTAVDAGITSISAANLQQFPQLIELELWRNRLTSLSADLFKYSSKLQRISFTQNLITNVGTNILAPLTQIKQAEFMDNVCIDAGAYSEKTFRYLKESLEANCPPLK
jgi:hypothetical protein